VAGNVPNGKRERAALARSRRAEGRTWVARLYRCSVGDLLVDLPDFRDHDEAPRAVLGAESGGLVAARHAEALLADLLPGHHGASARNGAR
jgi:hypothetical protein